MNRVAFVVAGIFLAVAIILPFVALITQTDSDLDNILDQAPNLSDQTQVQTLVSDIETAHSNLLTIVVTVDIVCIALFAVALWIGLRK
jgi:hypothetical protein